MRLLVTLMTLLTSILAAGGARGAAPLTIVVFGDSLTEGNMLEAGERGRLWVTLVQEESKGKLALVNEGKGGRPTNSVDEFRGMLGRHAQMGGLIIALGTNDSRDIKDDCVPKAVANIRAMITAAREAYGATLPILLVGPANIRKDALGPTRPIADQRDAKLRELGAAYEKLAKEMNCSFVSLYGVVPPESLSKDGVHPDGAGNEAMAKVLLPKALELAK